MKEEEWRKEKRGGEEERRGRKREYEVEKESECSSLMSGGESTSC